MSAKRPGPEFSNKTNVNPSVNRSTEATAEDFQEASTIFEDHADLLDQILGDLYHADFVGYFGGLPILQASIPDPLTDDFAVIVDAVGIPQKIAKVVNGQWVVQTSNQEIQKYPNKLEFPETGTDQVWYVAKDSRRTYLWYDGQYNLTNPDTGSGVSYSEQNPTAEQQLQAQKNLGIRTKTILISGQTFQYLKKPTNTTNTIQPGDLAMNGWISDNEFGMRLRYLGGDPEQLASWKKEAAIEY